MAFLGGLLGGKDKARAIEEYNLGLEAKYRGDWALSLAHNQRAAALNPDDPATWWNLGIAATALRDWKEARRAWGKYGITVDDGDGEVIMPRSTGCVRLNPSGSSEVVWGLRIDPARILIENVPLPESDRRCGDIILHDGAPAGTRTSNGREYSVFDELEVWKVSAYSTFEVDLEVPSDLALDRLVGRCRELQLGIEDWRTIRMLCSACSRGTPGEHTCGGTVSGNRYGFGATSEAELRRVLQEWAEMEDGAAVGEVTLLLPGVNA